jgi:hypothetical protein
VPETKTRTERVYYYPSNWVQLLGMCGSMTEKSSCKLTMQPGCLTDDMRAPAQSAGSGRNGEPHPGPGPTKWGRASERGKNGAIQC